MKHVYVLRMKDYIKERFSQVFSQQSGCVDNCENLSSIQNESVFLSQEEKSLHVLQM